MAIFSSLDMADDARHAIANGIFSAVTNDMPELIQEHNLPTNNGGSLFRWNFINRNISENLGGRFQTSYVKRGPWKLLILFEQNTGITFSIMTERNLSRLQRRLPNGIHYLESLIVPNVGYEVVEGQISFDIGSVQRDPSAVEKLRDELLRDFAGVIKNHILILFEYDYSRVLSARAILLTPELGIAYSEDWSRFLNKPYLINKMSIAEDLRNEDAEPLVRLKGQNDKPTSDDLVSLPEEESVVND